MVERLRLRVEREYVSKLRTDPFQTKNRPLSDPFLSGRSMRRHLGIKCIEEQEAGKTTELTPCSGGNKIQSWLASCAGK